MSPLRTRLSVPDMEETWSAVMPENEIEDLFADIDPETMPQSGHGVQLEDSGHTQVDAGTFDLGVYLERGPKFPRYSATIYTDMEAAMQISDLLDRISELDQKISGVQARGRVQAKSGGNSLAGSDVQNELDDLRTQRDELSAQHQELASQLQQSKLVFVLQLQEPNSSFEARINQAIKDKYPDAPGLFNRGQADHPSNFYRIYLMAAELLVEIRDHQGRTAAQLPGVDQIQTLCEGVYPSEWNKLTNAVGMATSGGNAVQKAVDAGFPG